MATDFTQQKNNDIHPFVQSYLQKPSPETAEPVLEHLRPTIDSALKSFAQGNKAYATKAKLMAMDSLSTWDPKKGALSTHAFNSMKRLYRVTNEQAQAIHVPENVRLDWLQVQKFTNDYKDTHDGIEPPRSAIADALGFSPKRVTKAFYQSNEAPSSSFDTEQGHSTLSKGKTPEDLWKDYVYHDLDEKNRIIFEHLLGYNGVAKLPKGDIAAKLKISAPAVSQRINTITKRLSEFYE